MTDDLRKRLRAKVDVGSSLLDGLPVNPDGPEAADRIEALTAENERLREAAIDVSASLVAAISLLERGGKAAKKAAPSDHMFDQMVLDYKASLNRARTALGDTQ